jgi:hypothetical protein
MFVLAFGFMNFFLLVLVHALMEEFSSMAYASCIWVLLFLLFGSCSDLLLSFEPISLEFTRLTKSFKQ